MSQVFNTNTYTLENLINYVDIGNIALPDLQRPFVWNKTKVRDLIDSIYNGLPVGLIILWKIAEPGEFKPIGLDKKSTPHMLVIDGQQRLTSLFSVIKNAEIIDKNFKKTKIKISFNPIEKKFEVCNPAIEKDAEWISDISYFFNNGSIKTFNAYLSRLKSKKLEFLIDEDLIASNIEKISKISEYPFSVLELSSDLDPEEVSEIFVRINSKGESLNQSDFILTLMAVYWEEGRNQLEEFSKKSAIYDEHEANPFNLINIRPKPEHILRTIVAYSFLRGRLKYAYLILKGRNLENQTTSIDERNKNFDIFREGQQKALDLTNWHDFIKIVHGAGFVDENQISSKTTFYVCYALYLLGKYNFSIPYTHLESIIRKWFVFSLITQRYTRSPETIIERDLQLFKGKDDFLDILKGIMETELTDDYWNITLPQRLVSSSTRNYAYKVHLASLIFRDVNVMFSNIKLRDYLNPLLKMKKSTLDLHHLFPKNYLKINGIDEQKDFNQVANYIHLEYKDNINISDKSPKEYWNEIINTLPDLDRIKLIEKYQNTYDLPKKFWNLEYFDFLEKRRKLMANGIKKYYNNL